MAQDNSNWERNHYNFCQAQDYADFIEFLEDELGIDTLDDILKRFNEKQERSGQEAYERLFPKVA